MNYDFSGFHKGCPNKQVLTASDGLYIVCLDCGVAANVEAISAKVSPADACRIGTGDRVVIGKQSVGVDKGVAK